MLFVLFLPSTVYCNSVCVPVSYTVLQGQPVLHLLREQPGFPTWTPHLQNRVANIIVGNNQDGVKTQWAGGRKGVDGVTGLPTVYLVIISCRTGLLTF